MTIKTVMKLLRQAVRYWHLAYDVDIETGKKLREMVVEVERVMGKREPMKPYKYRTEGDMSHDVYDCWECGTVITLNDTYCRRCGRVQMWED